MRLHEITLSDKLKPKKVELSPRRLRADNEFLQPDHKELGSGMFGAAFSTPTEPGSVRKVVGPIDVTKLEYDAYFQYVTALTKNDRTMSNPFFPRIFDIEVREYQQKSKHKTDYSDYVYAVDMERLHEFATLSEEEAKTIGHNLFHDFERIAVIRKEPQPAPEIQAVPHPHAFREAIINLLMDVVSSGAGQFGGHARDRIAGRRGSARRVLIKDPKLKQAVMLINRIRRRGGFFNDISRHNIMVRRSRGAPQIVFTDPLAN